MNKNFVGRRFKWLGVYLDVSPEKAKCVVCLFRNAIYVRIPWQVWRDVDNKIFCWRYRFQYAIVKNILCRNWVFGPCYVNDLKKEAFRGVRQAQKMLKMLLQYCIILMKRQVNNDQTCIYAVSWYKPSHDLSISVSMNYPFHKPLSWIHIYSNLDFQSRYLTIVYMYNSYGYLSQYKRKNVEGVGVLQSDK